MDIPNEYILFSNITDLLVNNLIGNVLLFLSVVLHAALISIFITIALKAFGIYVGRKIIVRVVYYITMVSPSIGLLGTIYGLIMGLNTADESSIPHFIGVALLTTFVGSVLYVIGFSTIFILSDDSHEAS